MKFYVVNKKPSGGYNFERFRTDFYYDESVAKSDAPRCPLCGAFVGMLVSIPPYRVRLETWGTGFGDLAFWMSDFLISATSRASKCYRFADMLNSPEKLRVTFWPCPRLVPHELIRTRLNWYGVTTKSQNVRCVFLGRGQSKDGKASPSIKVAGMEMMCFIHMD